MACRATMEEGLDQTEKPLAAARTPRFGLREQGMHHLGPVHWNLTAPYLYEYAVQRREGQLGLGGSFVVNTGRHTGRSPRDKYIVDEPGTKDTVWWGGINQPIEPDRFAGLQQRMLAYLQGRELFAQDLYAGADPEYRLPVRVITDAAWHSLFSRNMFIRPPEAELANFKPAFTILHAPEFRAIPELDGIRSETFILVNFATGFVLIGGTRYAGEIKKSVFGYLNFVLPARDVLPMHCSANVGPKGDGAIFFGLSGTGKTTLSAGQAMYHFLSGYTAQVAGTEVGLGKEPRAVFSTCFGAPFMPRHPAEYAKMLGERIARYKADCWLVNTGWSGGAYGVGNRMAIAHTRALLRAALDGSLAGVPMPQAPNFGFLVPESCAEIPGNVLDPRGTWSDKRAYDEIARNLRGNFEQNFAAYEPFVGSEVKRAAIRAAA